MPFFEKWYGWQTLLATVPADLLFVAGLYADNSTFTPVAWAVGVPVHMLTGPINHWVHGRAGKGFLVLGANLLFPVLGIAGGYPAMAVGYFATPLIDAALSIMPEKVHLPPRKAAAFMPSSVAIVPMIDANRKGLSIIGQF